MPPAAGKLVGDLKAAAGAASQLEAAEPDADRASLLVGIRDVAACAARVVMAHYGADRRYVVQVAHLLRAAAGHVLNDAEVLGDRIEFPELVPTLVLDRIQAQSVTGWARWEVLDAAGQLVGFVAEDREWLGHTYGPAVYEVAHNPTGEAFGALWRSEGHATPQEALAALAAHLTAPGGPGRGQSNGPGRP
jgi:hypothetical protein